MFKAMLFAVALVVVVIAVPITAWFLAIAFSLIVLYKLFKPSDEVETDETTYTRRGINTFQRNSRK